MEVFSLSVKFILQSIDIPTRVSWWCQWLPSSTSVCCWRTSLCNAVMLNPLVLWRRSQSEGWLRAQNTLSLPLWAKHATIVAELIQNWPRITKWGALSCRLFSLFLSSAISVIFNRILGCVDINFSPYIFMSTGFQLFNKGATVSTFTVGFITPFPPDDSMSAGHLSISLCLYVDWQPDHEE